MMMIQLLSHLIILCLSLGSVTIANGQVQKTNVKVLQGGALDGCPSIEERERARNAITLITNQAIASVTGTYTCNGTPGWRRVAFINMTDPSYNCPTGLNLTTHPKRTCRSPLRSGGCSSTTFRNVEGLPYRQVCGRIRGYQFGVTDAFHDSNQGIESYYVDGVSLTHGGAGNRQHIWTFASGLFEILRSPDFVINACPCDTSHYDVVPAFVGDDYFCESGITTSCEMVEFRFYPDDVLWDGQNCTSTSTCCQLNNPPWFTKNLPTNTTDDIELRICTSAIISAEDTPLELIELYVQ